LVLQQFQRVKLFFSIEHIVQMQINENSVLFDIFLGDVGERKVCLKWDKKIKSCINIMKKRRIVLSPAPK